MEQIEAVQSVSKQPGFREAARAKSRGVIQGDAFAALIQQLLGSGSDDSGPFAPLEGDERGKMNEMGAQMAAEMLYMMPNVQMLLQAPAQTQQLTGIVGDNSRIVSVFGTAQTVEPPVQQPEGTPAMGAEMEPDRFYSVLWDSKREPAMPKTEGLQWQDEAIRIAKDLLEVKKENNAPPLDIGSLQADVDMGRFLPVDGILKKHSDPLLDIPDISEQLKSGILDNVAKGKNEFIIRLQPEGIGEIVVKLSESKEKIALSIFTSNEQTARLITNEVVSLQNALRPLQAEVQQIVVASEEYAGAYAAQTATSDQEHTFQEHTFSGQGGHSANGRSQDGDEFENAVQAILADDGLDTYI